MGAARALSLRVGWGWLSGDDLSNHLLTLLPSRRLAGDRLPDPGGRGQGWASALRHRATSIFVVTAVGFAVITFVVPVFVRGVGPSLVPVSGLYVGSRYSATPILLVWSAVLAEALQLTRVAHRRVTKYVPALACLILLTPVWVLDFRAANLRTPGPSWSKQVAAAVATCEAHPKKEAVLQISPAGWKVVLPCGDVS